MRERQIKRAVLLLPLCLTAGLMSCYRQPRSSSEQAPPPSRNAQTQNLPQRAPTTPQPRAAIVAVPNPTEQPDATGAQQPDRIFSSGHTLAVTAVAFSPARRWAPTGSEDKTIRIWELASSRELRVLTGHTDRVTSLAYSP